MKTILFDLDGTLTDSGEGIINCVIVALEHFGLPIPSREELRVFVGPPLDETFMKYGVPREKTDEAISVYRSRYIPIGKFENKPYPGIPQLLKKLNDSGYKLFVATSKPEETAIEILEHFDLDKYFVQICGAAMDRSRVNKEDVIAYLLAQNERSDKIIMVGDTAFDVIGAKKHNIPTIGVSWGYGLVEEMETAGASAIVHTTEELLSILERM